MFTPDEITALAKAIAAALIHELPTLAAPQPIAAAVVEPRTRFQAGPIVVDVARHEVRVNDVEAQLQPREFAVITALAQNAGLVLTREKLLEIAWPSEKALELESNRVVDVMVRRLRLKLGDEDGRLIETVHGSGYKLRDR